MNPALNSLQAYPFEKLTALKAEVDPVESLDPILLSVGEPKHSAPQAVLEQMTQHLSGVETYPSTRGSEALRRTIKHWLDQRFRLDTDCLDPDKHILPVNGTREALFAFAQAVVDPTQESPLVLSPNPFYQIYEGAAYLAGAEPYYYPLNPLNDYQPDFDSIDDAIWKRCQLLYICSPGNPSGAVIPKQSLQTLIRKAIEYDFVIASDECYSEIYFDQPPMGLLEAAADMGHTSFKHCMVFHSLSKRSNLPGLRSGFVAGDPNIIRAFFQYRTYHGCAMSPVTQHASITAWSDEQHVMANRQAYTQKFDAVIDILRPVLDLKRPEASFYLWPQTPICDIEFAQQLYAQQNVTVLPGSYLSREVNGHNPGAKHVRMALVAELDQCIEAAQRIKYFIESL